MTTVKQMDLLAIDEPEVTTDPLDGEQQTQQRRRHLAYVLCARAQNRSAWQLADKLARAWELGGCLGCGVPQPTETEKTR